MEPHCCARCRLLQPPADACRECGHAAPRTLLELSTPQVDGVLPISRRPSGQPDTEPITESLVAVGAGAAGLFILRNPLGLLAAPVVAWLLRRARPRVTEPAWRQRLTAVPAPQRPSGVPLAGTAEKLERTIGEGHHAALLKATAIHSDEGLLVRAVEAVPFWLVVDAGRRLLVTGTAWAEDVHPPPAHGVAYLDELGCPDLPVSRAIRRRLRGHRTVIRPGDPIAIVGEPRHEQLPISAGYRDALGETLRGEPGAPLWIEKRR